jgi:hypothetical protein
MIDLREFQLRNDALKQLTGNFSIEEEYESMRQNKKGKALILLMRIDISHIHCYTYSKRIKGEGHFT